MSKRYNGHSKKGKNLDFCLDRAKLYSFSHLVFIKARISGMDQSTFTRCLRLCACQLSTSEGNKS